VAALYRPAHQWQGDPNDDDPYGWFGCTSYAYAMGIDAITKGAVVPSGYEIRQLTDEAVPNPTDPGLTLQQVDAAGNRFGVDFYLRTGPWRAVEKDLTDQRWTVLQVWYPRLGAAWMFQNPGNFGHAIGVMAISGDGRSALVYDSLGHAARWTPLAVLRAAAEEWGRRIGLRGGDVRWLASITTIPKV